IQPESSLHSALPQVLVHQQDHARAIAVEFVDHLRKRFTVEYQQALTPSGDHGGINHPGWAVLSLAVAQLLVTGKAQALSAMIETQVTTHASDQHFGAGCPNDESATVGADPATAGAYPEWHLGVYLN